jgi:uncharacterized membrane protein
MQQSDKLFIVGFLVVIVAIVGLLTYFVVAPKMVEPFTEFYVLGSNGNLTDYPLILTLGETGNITLGIINHEQKTTTYIVVVNLDNKTIKTIDDVTLVSEENWNANCSFTPQISGDRIQLTLELYKDDDLTAPYRNLQLWINVQQQP